MKVYLVTTNGSTKATFTNRADAEEYILAMAEVKAYERFAYFCQYQNCDPDYWIDMWRNNYLNDLSYSMNLSFEGYILLEQTRSYKIEEMER